MCCLSRDGRIRTGDPLNPIQVRYRAAPRPEAGQVNRRVICTQPSRDGSWQYLEPSLARASRPACRISPPSRSEVTKLADTMVGDAELSVGPSRDSGIPIVEGDLGS